MTVTKKGRGAVTVQQASFGQNLLVRTKALHHLLLIFFLPKIE